MSTYARAALVQSAQAIPTARLVRVVACLERVRSDRAVIYRAELDCRMGATR